MSNEYYKARWQEAVNDLMEQVQLENIQLETDNQLGVNFHKSDYEKFQFFAQLYIKYIDVYKKLEECFDGMVHPQKRILLKDMLENTMVRMCEIKKQLILRNTHSGAYQCDFVNLDELIMDLKLTPDALEVPIPRYFREEDKKRLDERNQILDKLLLDFHETSAPEEEVIQEMPQLEPNMEIMICLIQKNERGRQGIERALQYKFSQKMEQKRIEKNKKLAQGFEVQEEVQRDEAVMVFQKYWRGYKAREHVYNLRGEELQFLGMKKQYENPKDPNSQFSKSATQKEKMKLIQEAHQKEYVNALDNLKNLVRKNEGPEIKENKIKERKEWIEKYLDMTENSKGWIILIDMIEKLPEKAADFHDQEKKFPPEDADANQKGGKKDQKKEPPKKGKKDKKGNAQEEKKDELTEQMKTVLELNSQIESYSKTWGATNDSDNFQQKYVTEMAMNEKRPEVEQELDSIVDELIEIELDNRHLYLFNKARKRKKEKVRKPPKPKKKKVPGMNQAKGRSPLDMLSELVEAGIVKKLMPAKMSDLKGEQNVLGCIQERQFDIMPDPSMAQIRQILAEYVAIPLGSSVAKEKLEKINFFLFYGPMGSGKTLAVRALAHECNALVVDLSPSTIENKATDKNSIAKTFYMAFTVAREFQPCIIFMDEIEQVFGAAKKKKGVPAAAWVKLKKPLQDFKKAKYIEFKIVVDRVVTPHRIKRLDEDPLKLHEFIGPLSKVYSLNDEEYLKIRTFTDDVTGMKDRREREKNAQNNDKKGTKKGKK